ncbi:MAG: FAD-binding oxidoreductase [Candidatus Obscuribacterales bacterium]|nr:FAD-binding oxidoreductase [Candidatus Obscuribacterales bacterium]
MLKYVLNKDCCSADKQAELVNDRHSSLNPTALKRRIEAKNLLQLQAEIKRARQNKESVAIAGGRHAMGGQQFCKNGVLLDMQSMNRVLNFDEEHGLIEVEAGMEWTELIDYLQSLQSMNPRPWSIIQKQTGCNKLSIGGSLSANVHGRGLKLAPFVSSVENFTILRHDGELLKCSREENSELFELAIGGYGLFGVISSASLRLAPRKVLRRDVRLADSLQAVALLEESSKNGAEYGDFQFSIDSKSADFLRCGILSTYTPVQVEAESIPVNKRLLEDREWTELLYLAHTDKSLAFKKYADHYLSTAGQLYLSDTFQLATYFDSYHKDLDRRMPERCPGSEMISELYVPRDLLGSFLAKAALLLKEHRADLIYGTVRLIEEDKETFLPWAKKPWACIVMNLHVEHSPHGVAAAAKAFCALIDLALAFGGSYYLTYHRFASREQILTAYPELPEFMELKQAYDPDETFCSDWYLHTKDLIS